MLALIVSNAQQPSFQNLKQNKAPYAQFNDIVEYRKEMWFITNEGVSKYHKNNIVEVIKKENLSKFIVVENALFVWSIYGEFYHVLNGKLTPLPFNSLLIKRLENKIINSVVYSDSTFWISNVVGSGLIKINLKEESIKSIGISEDFPHFVFNQNKVLISGNNINASKKQLVVNFKTPLYIPLAENLSFSKTNLLRLKDGSFIFTRQFEAIHFNKNKILNRVFVEKNIEDVIESMDGKIWLSLNNGGIISYANASFNSSNSVKYLGDKTVISISEDRYGNLWFGTSGDGVYKLKKTLPIKYDAPKVFSSTNKKEENIKSLLVVSPLPDINTETSKIISTVSPQNIEAPSVFINGIKINGIGKELLSYFELSSSENNIEINISGVHSASSELQYKYILEGEDTSWNYSTSTSYYYSSLSPGNYTFSALAMNDRGIWSKTPVITTFSIAPPFYQSVWFVLAIVLLLIAICLTTIYIQNRKKERRSQKIEEEKRKALLSELHALRSQMNPHFIFNTLSSIQSFITQNNSKDAVGYLSKFSKLMRSTLENTKQQKISVKDEIEMLSLYMDLEKLRLNNKFNYEINVSENIDVQFDEIPPLLVQPYVENAIWHGISHKDKAGIIKIDFELIDENNLKCTVEDDGVGRKASKEIARSQKKNKSLGMSITKERLEIINSLKNSSLNINIVDLEENDIALGTRIELFIPLD